MQLRLFRPNPPTRTTRWATTWARRKCVLKRSNAKGLPKLCAAYLKLCSLLFSPRSLPAPTFPFYPFPWLGLAHLSGRQAGRQAKMQIFVKYMRVKIVVLHYPFNWIWRAHAGLKANANTRSHQLSRQITAPEAAGKVGTGTGLVAKPSWRVFWAMSMRAICQAWAPGQPTGQVPV